MTGITELQRQITDCPENGEIKLDGKIKLEIGRDNKLYVGRQFVQGFIKIEKPGITINGANADIEVMLNNCVTNDCCLFYLTPTARGVRFVNINLKITVDNAHTEKHFYAFYNTAYGVTFDGCHVNIRADRQVSLAAIYNNGNYDYHLDTRADNLNISNCQLLLECQAEEYPNKCEVYGLYNYYANSISVHDSYIHTVMRGNGEKQRATGVYTNGRFGRFVGNNIKANCAHPEGLERNQAHAYGYIDGGWQNIVSANNVVAEWAGMCVGIEARGLYAEIESNKIHSTHTVYGRSVILGGEASLLRGNVITSTGRNARLVEIEQGPNIISGNVLAVLRAPEEMVTSCGIYCVADELPQCIITENIMRYITDCGILYASNDAVIERNFMHPETKAVLRAGKDRSLITLFDPSRIRDIEKESKE